MLTTTPWDIHFRRILDLDLLNGHNPKFTLPALKILVQIITNILHNPKDPKYKQIKARNKRFGVCLELNGFVDLLREIGFHSRVVEFEETWVFGEVKKSNGGENSGFKIPLPPGDQNKDLKEEKNTGITDAEKSRLQMAQKIIESTIERLERGESRKLNSVKEMLKKKEEENTRLRELVEMDRRERQKERERKEAAKGLQQ